MLLSKLESNRVTDTSYMGFFPFQKVESAHSPLVFVLRVQYVRLQLTLACCVSCVERICPTLLSTLHPFSMSALF